VYGCALALRLWPFYWWRRTLTEAFGVSSSEDALFRPVNETGAVASSRVTGHRPLSGTVFDIAQPLKVSDLMALRSCACCGIRQRRAISYTKESLGFRALEALWASGDSFPSRISRVSITVSSLERTLLALRVETTTDRACSLKPLQGTRSLVPGDERRKCPASTKA